MRKAYGSAILAGAAVLLSACRPSTPLPARSAPEDCGYRQTVIGQTVIAEAIRRANLLMQNQVRIRLQPGWLSQQDLETASGGKPITFVPVYLIFPGELTPGAVAFVPKGKLCIFVNSARVRDLTPAFGFQPEAFFGGDMDLRNLWTVILLHEAGHVFYSDQARREHRMIGDVDELNLAREIAKIVELRADHFAAMQIRITDKPGVRGDWTAGLAPEIEHAAAARYLGDPSEAPGALGNRAIAVEAEMVVNAVGLQVWSNLADRRKYLTEKELQALSWDRGFSHPNLGLRFIYMASVLDPGNWVTKKQLYDFLQARNQKARDALYRSEYTGLLDDGIEPGPTPVP
jgi:hypothetical protein